MKTIIASHGDLAKGIMNSLEMIIGKQKDMYFESFQTQDSIETFTEKIQKHIDEADGKDILILCDIMGGTPYNVSALLSMKNKNVCVLYGINLPMLIEISMQKDTCTNAQIKEYVNSNLLNTAGFFEDPNK
ncbi:PTS sugar transporter subunit IIA [Abyssisolibacter fermentans]|uniref:PTS sugar transporter subunit IIA n=1 Tax=Abyssisolibacter fermentans TaxID=1766203 RepID=UPI0008334043|nr:PTS sugar transporter subunit IIA [Abyssisolibacter fermentans]